MAKMDEKTFEAGLNSEDVEDFENEDMGLKEFLKAYYDGDLD
jgi:hypothetical protein